MALLGAAGIRVVPTGLQHGTVTALAGRRRYEVTTLRRDVASYGRHAEVEFTDDFVEDARPARLHHQRHELRRRRPALRPVRRPGRPARRPGPLRRRRRASGSPRTIYASCASSASTPASVAAPADAAALAACAELAPGIDRLSGERVRQELLRSWRAAGRRAALRADAGHGRARARRCRGRCARALAAPARRLAGRRPAAAAGGPAARRLARWRRVERLAARLRLSKAEAERLPAAADAAARRRRHPAGAAPRDPRLGLRSTPISCGSPRRGPGRRRRRAARPRARGRLARAGPAGHRRRPAGTRHRRPARSSAGCSTRSGVLGERRTSRPIAPPASPPWSACSRGPPDG